ncbi:hypothetical protein VPSG_00031 [Vibrio phage pYD38-B]|uniref:hypothetical protein n=1 Tax=Vibrio phage pYD38-B TaxID=929835 RepID=UPI0003429322|nr:hypothetical protein VPSG_00031 [Vibrio phage pYD38-B]AGN34350.1 hypothetical protein VPSG_00031 [Vibrio phage pYD38-B]
MLKTKSIQVCTVADVLVKTRGNQLQAAKILGIHRGSLFNWIKAGIEKEKLVRVEIHGDFEEKLTVINH